MTTAAGIPAFLEGALLVRVPAAEPDWIAGLPPAPPGWRLTVTIGGDARGGEIRPLARRGYALVGSFPRQDGIRVADVLVPEDLRERERPWWWSLLLLADRVFDPRLGPVQVVLGAVLERHAEALSDHLD